MPNDRPEFADLQKFYLYRCHETFKVTIELKVLEPAVFESSLTGYDHRFIMKSILRFLLKLEARYKNVQLTELNYIQFENLYFPDFDNNPAPINITAINILEKDHMTLFLFKADKCIGTMGLDSLVEPLRNSSETAKKKHLAAENWKKNSKYKILKTWSLKHMSEEEIQQQFEKFTFPKNLPDFSGAIAVKYSASVNSLILLTLFFIEGYLRDRPITNPVCYKLPLGITQSTIGQKLTTLVTKGILSDSKRHKNIKELNKNFLTCLQQGEVKITLFAKTKNLEIDLTPYIKVLISVDEELIELATKKGLAHHIIPDIKNLEVATVLQQLLDDNSVRQPKDQQNTANFLGSLDKALKSTSIRPEKSASPEIDDWNLDETEETIVFDPPKNS